MKSISLLLKKSILGFFVLFVFTACDYKKTTIEVGSLFDPTFDFSKSSELTFDENNVEIKDGKVQLKPLDLKHEGDDFNNGSHVGSSLTGSALNIISGERFELDPSWTPEYSSIISYWNFNMTLEDQTSNGNDIVVVGDVQLSTSDPFLGTGKLSSLGVSGSGTVADSVSIKPQNELTIQVWFKLNGYSNAFFAGKRVSTGCSWNSYSIDYGSLFSSNQFTICTTTTGGQKTIITGQQPALGQWHHLVGTYDGSYMRIYLNGFLMNESATTGDIIYDSEPFQLGSFSGWDLDGELDEVTVWSKALSTENIKSIYDRQKIMFSAELSADWTPKWDNIVGYWKMDGTWQDSSGNDNHGSPNNLIDHSTNAKVGSQSAEKTTATDYINVGVSPFFENSAQAMTVVGWFYVDPLDFDGSYLYILDTATGNPVVNDGVSILFDDRGGSAPTSSLYFDIKTSGSRERVYGLPNAIDQKRWYHLAFTYGDDIAKIFIDGVDVSDLRVDGVGTFVPRNQSMYIGAVVGGSGGGPSFFDDIAIFSVNLSAAEINQIFHRQKQKYASHYDSQVVDLGSAQSIWPDLGWLTNLPFGKELVGDFDSDGNPDSESSSDYTLLTQDLSYDLIANWSFNEGTKSSGPGGSDFRDSSGQALHLTESSAMVLGQMGKFSNGLFFDGVDDKLSVPLTGEAQMSTESEAAVSLWLKVPTQQLDTSSGTNYIIENFDNTGLLHYNLSVRINNQTFVSGSKNPGSIRCARYDGTNNPTAISDKLVNDFQWHHILCQTRNGRQELYIDGKLDTSITDSTIPLGQINDNQFSIGSSISGLRNFIGSLDEVSIWKRSLSLSEIQQLYRRGANRIKFQVKTCVDSSCECKSLSTSPVGSATDCDGDTIANTLDFDDIYKAEFIGPGGDGTTYYSELFNRKSTDLTFNCGLNTSDSNSNVCVNDEITLGSGPRPTSPVIDYSDFPLAARPDANPYFQYRVYMEADENTACNGSPCLPELTSVNLNPDGNDKFYGGLQEVAANKPISYSAINSLTVTADDCATFQLSPNGSDYYYWSTSSWVLATVPSHRSSKDDLENNIVSFATQSGPGLLYIKSFLETNASQTQNCSVQSIDLNYSKR